MPVGVVLTFDGTTETTIRRTWEALAEAGVSSSMLVEGLRPHLSLCVCDKLDAEGLQDELSSYMTTISPFPLLLSSIGIFPTEEGILFFGVTVTKELLSLHAAVHRLFEEHAKKPWPHYRPLSWVPHCTLAVGLSPSKIAKAVSISRGASLPIHAQAEALEIIKVSRVGCETLFSHTLAESKRGTINA